MSGHVTFTWQVFKHGQTQYTLRVFCICNFSCSLRFKERISFDICAACVNSKGYLLRSTCYIILTNFNDFSNQSDSPFKINLTASCNFGCECDMNDVQPVCGSNGLTYFSPCHAGCSQGSTSGNFSNCACEYQTRGYSLMTSRT